MSKIHQKVLVAAIAMGLSSAAMAAEINKAADNPERYVHAWEVTGAASATRTANVAGDVVYNVKNGDNLVLRA